MIKHQTRIILAGMMGNLVESFDLAICGLLSVYLAKYLMGDPRAGLLIVFTTYFAGYLARPLGAIVMGLFSDIYGRKITLAASILSMGIATAFIGFIPPKSALGMGSMVILLILRIIQSFCCGGEYLNSSAYLVENAEASQKGYSGSWAPFGTMAGLLLASLATLGVTYLVNNYPELEWIVWRMPFFLALLGSSIGLYIRLFIPESLEYIMYYAEHPKPKVAGLFKQSLQYIARNKLKSLYVFALSALGVSTTFQIYIYGPTQAHIYGHLTSHQIILSNIISLFVMLSVFPIIGRLSDMINREIIVVFAALGFLMLSKPYFEALSYGDYENLILIQSLISIPAAAYYATVPVILAEMFPLNLRCTVLSVLYSTTASLAAGLAPVLSLMLLKRTNNPASPSLLIVVLVILALTVMWMRYFKTKSLDCINQLQ